MGEATLLKVGEETEEGRRGSVVLVCDSVCKAAPFSASRNPAQNEFQTEFLSFN